MFKGAYREEELVSNRSPVLLCGGSEKDRRLWAEEALASFEGAQLVSVKAPNELSTALALKDAVVLVEDVSALPDQAQAQIVHCLHRQEERPKLILGLKLAADQARAQGLLREDLHFRLSIAKVDLAQSRVLESARKRPPPKPVKVSGKSAKK